MSAPLEEKESCGEFVKEPTSGENHSEESTRPFRLVKYFSFTGFIAILIFTLGLTVFLSQQGKSLTLRKSNDYARLLADNLNHQVFLQFVIPTALQFGRIRLRDPVQFNRLDTVVRNIIHSLNVQRVNIYDLEGNISYSTDKDLVGKKATDNDSYEEALKGESASLLITRPGKSWVGLDQSWTLRTFFPFRAEEQLQGPVGEVLGVFEIYQDLTDDYAILTRFQILSVSIALSFAGVLFVVLRQIIVRGERIIEARNQERRRLQEKLHQSKKLATLGQMVAAVAHEIRNPLGIISSTAEILQSKVKKYEPNNRLGEVIVEESSRLNGIVTEFLDFARPQVPKLTMCNIEDILEKNLNYLSPQLEKEGVEVIRDYAGEEAIEADQDLLFRAFLNIFMNAIQAMPDGGEIKVSTSTIQGPNGQPAGEIEVVIADTGTGIDPEQVAQLFDPFYTTKNRGSGLGLAIVKNIIEEHKGSVVIEPGPEEGTRLIVRLPTSGR